MKRVSTVLEKSGITIPYYSWDVENPHQVIVFAHGLKSHAGWFLDTGDALAERNIRVYAFDRRGSGRSDESRGHIDDYHMWLDDLDAMVCLSSAENGAVRPHLLGHCFGAKLAMAYAAMNTDSVSSLMLIAPPQLALKTNISTMDKLKVVTSLLIGINASIPVPVHDDMFTRDEGRNEFIRNDELRLRHMSPKFCAEIFRLDRWLNKRLKSISIPTLILLASDDDVVDNNRVIKKVFPQLGCKRKSIDVFDCYHHLLYEPFANQVIDRIMQWMGGSELAMA